MKGSIVQWSSTRIRSQTRRHADFDPSPVLTILYPGPQLELSQKSHRRFNPLTNEWVLVSPHRTQRPWQGALEAVPAPDRPQYDPTCYLCPGNQRAGGVRNPQYESTFVFDNDFAALQSDSPVERVDLQNKGLLVAEGEPGICRVMCFSPRHDLTLSSMVLPEIEGVIRAWTAQFVELAATPNIHHVQIFENRGEMMGASTLPNLGDPFDSAGAFARTRFAAGVLCDTPRVFAVPLHKHRGRGTVADCLGKRWLHHDCSLLGRVALRSVALQPKASGKLG